MASFTEVDPESFIHTESEEPANGRGAWSHAGINSDETRYYFTGGRTERVGSAAEKSLAHWAVSAGVYAIQSRLTNLGHLDTVVDEKRGVFNRKTKRAVKRFQAENFDPATGKKLVVDGIVGMSDARALFTPRITHFEDKYRIPGHFLLGETNHESLMDPGAVGYFIYYPDYRGVDRGMSQINSRAHPEVTWYQAFTPNYSIKWSAERLRAYYDAFKREWPAQKDSTLWDAAICAHNSPVNGRSWAKNGEAPNSQAANYVNGVKDAIYL